MILFAECLCNEEGSVGIACDENSGKCTCKENMTGDKCDRADDGFYGFPVPIGRHLTFVVKYFNTPYNRYICTWIYFF